MTVFKTFLKVLNKNKLPVIIYTVILVLFGALNMQTSETNVNFEATKADIAIVNEDKEVGLTADLIQYLKDNSNVVLIDEEEIDDALFYRQLNYVIYIPAYFREDFLNKKEPKIEIKKTGDYNSSLANILLERYLDVANSYLSIYDNEEEIILNIDKTLSEKTEIVKKSNLDTNTLSKATFYFNFMNYSMLAGTIYVICLVLSSFNQSAKKRIIISSMNYKKHNRILLFANILFACFLWLCYIVLSFLVVGKVMFTYHGLLYILNSFVFTICAVAIAFLINNLINNKDAINGIINVVALGSSFLCGSFVPIEYLPDSVVVVSKVLPSYWFINTNEKLKSLEVIDLISTRPLLVNMLVLIGFTALFIGLANLVSRLKRKID